METKECRHCKQPIHKDARRCQHCQGMQSWISDQKDPRVWLVVFVPILIVIAFFIWLPQLVTKPLERTEIDKTSLSIANVSYRFSPSTGSQTIYIYGDISNSSLVDAGQTCVRVNLVGDRNKVIDSFVQIIDRSIVPAKATSRFRVMAQTPASPDEIKKADVVVERSRTRGRWD